MLEKLSRQFRFAVFTGRPREEAAAHARPLRAGSLAFDPIVGMDDVEEPQARTRGTAATSPRDESRRKAYLRRRYRRRCALRPRRRGARSSASPRLSNPRYLDLVFLFQAEGAYAIVDDINYLDEVFAA